MKRSFIIDTDTASDDAVALIMAHRFPDVVVETVTVVSGNVPVDQGVRNALYTLELCGASTPVFRGEEKPLERPAEYAQYFHGEDGLGDQGYPPPQRKPESGHAVDAMLETVKLHPGITLVTLGPLTNVALAVMKNSEVMKNVGRCIVMGGAACTVGNVTPAAEFNIWVDPEAAKVVFASGMPIEMVGWELCRDEANASLDDIKRMRQMDTVLSNFTVDCNATGIKANREQTGGEGGISLPDPVAMAVALDPAVCTNKSDHWVEIETGSHLTRGMTVVDQIGVAERDRNQQAWGPKVASRGKTTVCWTIDVPRFKEMLFEALG